jgi:hypothetical protein
LLKLRTTDENIIKIEAQIQDVKSRIETLQEAKANDKLLRDFVKNKGKLIEKFQQELYNLDPEDKKRLVESMLDEKIRIAIDENEISWANLPFRFRFNPSILEEFIKQGKISKLDQNGRYCIGAYA